MRCRMAWMLCCLLVSWAVPASADEAKVFAALDAVGALDGRVYDPKPVIAAVNLLQPLGVKSGLVLRCAVTSRG